MANRWCIVGDPRCGSHWLSSIMPPEWVSLNEIANYDMYTDDYFDFGFKHKNYVKIINIPTEPLSRKEFIEKRTEQIKKIHPHQDLKAILFCNDHHMPYEKFIKELDNANFRFIFLERNLLDRALSHIIIKITKIAHRWKDDSNTAPADSLGPITIKLDAWVQQLFQCYQSTEYRKKLFKNYKHITIRYEHAKADCFDNNIPVFDQNLLHKTWAVEYKDVITNIDELVDVHNGFVENLPMYSNFFLKYDK